MTEKREETSVRRRRKKTTDEMDTVIREDEPVWPVTPSHHEWELCLQLTKKRQRLSLSLSECITLSTLIPRRGKRGREREKEREQRDRIEIHTHPHTHSLTHTYEKNQASQSIREKEESSGLELGHEVFRLTRNSTSLQVHRPRFSLTLLCPRSSLSLFYSIRSALTRPAESAPLTKFTDTSFTSACGVVRAAALLPNLREPLFRNGSRSDICPL